jgi:hypothetical protein
MSRRGIVTTIVCIVMCLLTLAGASVFMVMRADRYRTQVETLARQANEQIAMLDYYEARLALLQQEAPRSAAAAGAVAGSDPAPGQALAEDAQEAIAQTATEDTTLVIYIRDAVEQINADFQGSLEAQIAIAELGSPADETEVVYSGDVEGDSDTVNNWADVLAVFAVTKSYDIGTIQMINADDYAQLEQIYDDMNHVSIYCETSAKEIEAAEGEEAAIATKLALCVMIESMDCMEYAESLGWSGNQKGRLKALMNPDYYMTFAALLGVDLYDDLNSAELADIIAELEPGRIGTTIVEAALTRVGDPYSRSRRGSGDYVDCSYFTYWVYKQAGIEIPTSSVEQARYCYNSGYEINLDDLQPGDLLYWSKRHCHCGRWREIHHAGIYLGNGMIIDASSSKGCVVIRRLWGVDGGGEWRLAMCARPYTEAAATSVPNAVSAF